MKKKYIILLMLFICFNLFSIDEETISLIYEKNNQGVVYIEQSLFFDSNDVDNKDLFKKIEEEYEIEILDQYMSLGSGTGFFVTNSGYLITNHHVIDNTNIEKIKSAFLKIVRDEFLYNIPSHVLTYNEKDLIYYDFKKLINKSTLSYRILVNGEESFDADLVSSDKDLDLALLKAKSSNFTALPLASSDTLKVGNSIVAIGYPLPSAMFNIVKDFKSTMTTGNVSSIRSDTWGIQHTAAINPGNSGGPLFNAKGEVIGINVGLMQNANDIYFSIASDKLMNWLKDVNKDMILTQNKKDAKGIGSNYDVNNEGYLETSSIVFIDLPADYNVYLDGKWKGKTPLVLKSISQGKHVIKIESSSEFVVQKILVKSELNDIFEYSPRMTKYKGKIFVNTDPLKASVYIDDEKVGTSPYMKEINTGKHKIEIKLDGYTILNDEVDIKKNTLLEKEYKLEKGYRILFSSSLPNDTKIKLKKGNKSFEYSLKEKFWIENGDWEVIVKSESFSKKTFNIKINNEDEMIEFNPEYILSTIKFDNLKKDSKIMLDGEDITDKIENLKYETSIGKHKLEIINDKYETVRMTINVKKDEINKVNIDYEFKDEYKKKERKRSFAKNRIITGSALFMPGMLCLFGGVAMIGVGAYYYDEGIISNSYNSYSSTSSRSRLFQETENFWSVPIIIGGVILTLAGTTLSIIGLILMSTAGMQRIAAIKKIDEKGFDFLLNINSNDVELCFSKKF